MISNNGKLLIVQCLLAIVVTYCLGVTLYYMPDVPPVFRPFVPKGIIKVTHGKDPVPDERFMEWFNRDPERNVPTEANVIVAPADAVKLACAGWMTA